MDSELREARERRRHQSTRSDSVGPHRTGASERRVAVAVLLLLASVLLTGACKRADESQSDPERMCESWQATSSGEVAVDLHYESPLDQWYQLEPGGRLPAFTLFPSGRAIWLRVMPATPTNVAPWRLFQVGLTPEEVRTLCREFVAAGGLALPERDEMIDDREFDRAWAVVRFKDADGGLVTRRVYTGEPVASVEWPRVERVLGSFSHPRESEFNPVGATLFLSICAECPAAKAWPLSPDLLDCLSSATPRGSVKVSREELERIVPNRTWNPGGMLFEHSGTRVAVAVVPEVSDWSEPDRQPDSGSPRFGRR